MQSSGLLDSEGSAARSLGFKIPVQRPCSVDYQWVGEAITAVTSDASSLEVFKARLDGIWRNLEGVSAHGRG